MVAWMVLAVFVYSQSDHSSCNVPTLLAVGSITSTLHRGGLRGFLDDVGLARW